MSREDTELQKCQLALASLQKKYHKLEVKCDEEYMEIETDLIRLQRAYNKLEGIEEELRIMAEQQNDMLRASKRVGRSRELEFVKTQPKISTPSPREPKLRFKKKVTIYPIKKRSPKRKTNSP